jgi:hypothetical protein
MALFKGRFTAVLAFALAWSSVQCAALCATEPCAAPAPANAPIEPPCHHHHAPSNPTPASCQHQQLAQADVPQAFATPAFNASIAAMEIPVALHVQFSSPSGTPDSLPDVSWPPGFELLSSVVLRI